jgi:alcohol dehydrogenase class IV
MVPDAVVLDADLLRDLPAPVMAATGMDALAQLIEAFVTRRANPFTDALCRAGIPRAAQALRSACSSADTDDARETLLLAACWSGIALANAGLGAVHGMAAVLGGSTPAPHGFVCAVLLAPACAINIARLRAASPPQPALKRYAELARLLTGAAEAGPDDAVAWLHRLTADLPLDRAPLERMAAVPEDRLIAGALAASSMNGNPVTLDARDVRAIWQAAVAS